VLILLLIIATARILLILFAGVLGAILLRACSEWLSRLTRVPVLVVLFMLVTAGLALVTLSLYFQAAALNEQLQAVARQIPQFMTEAKRQLRTLHLPHPLDGGTAPVSGPSAHAESVLPAIAGALGSSLEVLASLVVVFFVTIYGAIQPQLYSRSLLSVVPEQHRERVQRALRAAHQNITRWMLGRMVAMLFVGLAATLGFELLGLPAPVLLGLFAGAMAFIEYAGAVISAVPPVLLALSQGPVHALWVLILFTVLHIIEGYVLTPLLSQASVRFPPALALAGQVLFGALLGPLGLTFSTPLLVLVVSSAGAWDKESSPVGKAEQRGTNDT
jgi:predicted PurR-regulated permease PerM